MTRVTITSPRQIAWLERQYPRSPNRERWAIGYSAHMREDVAQALAPLAAGPGRLIPWWEITPAPLP